MRVCFGVTFFNSLFLFLTLCAFGINQQFCPRSLIQERTCTIPAKSSVNRPGPTESCIVFTRTCEILKKVMFVNVIGSCAEIGLAFRNIWLIGNLKPLKPKHCLFICWVSYAALIFITNWLVQWKIRFCCFPFQRLAKRTRAKQL